MRDRRVKVLFDRLKIFVSPERVDDRILSGAVMTPRNNEAEDVAGASCRPGVGGKRPRRIAEDLYRSEHVDSQIDQRPRRYLSCGDRFGWRVRNRRQLRAQILRQHFLGNIGRE